MLPTAERLKIGVISHLKGGDENSGGRGTRLHERLKRVEVDPKVWSRYVLYMANDLHIRQLAGEVPQIDWDEVTQGRPLRVDIGMGMGERIISLAEGDDSRYYLGMEVYSRYIQRAVVSADEKSLENFSVMMADAAWSLTTIAEGGVEGVTLFFPPVPHNFNSHPKHRKNEIVTPVMMKQVARVLKDGGYFYFKSDSNQYLERVKAMIEANFPELEIVVTTHGNEDKDLTRYQAIWQGHEIPTHALICVRKNRSSSPKNDGSI